MKGGKVEYYMTIKDRSGVLLVGVDDMVTKFQLKILRMCMVWVTFNIWDFDGVAENRGTGKP